MGWWWWPRNVVFLGSFDNSFSGSRSVRLRVEGNGLVVGCFMIWLTAEEAISSPYHSSVVVSWSGRFGFVGEYREVGFMCKYFVTLCVCSKRLWRWSWKQFGELPAPIAIFCTPSGWWILLRLLLPFLSLPVYIFWGMLSAPTQVGLRRQAILPLFLPWVRYRYRSRLALSWLAWFVRYRV